jgi:hypothetical protein
VKILRTPLLLLLVGDLEKGRTGGGRRAAAAAAMDEGERGGEGEVREGAGRARAGQISNPKVPRHCGWRRTLTCRATAGGAALAKQVPPCRCGSTCCATADGAARSSAALP